MLTSCALILAFAGPLAGEATQPAVPLVPPVTAVDHLPVPPMPPVPLALPVPPVPLAPPVPEVADVQAPERPPRPPREPRTPQAPAAPAPPAAPAAPAAPAPPAPPPAPAYRGLPVNVQVELTISDRTGSAAPETKTVSVITSDATWGRIRAGATTQVPRSAAQRTTLNVDARPVIEQDTAGKATDRVRLDLTLEYQPARGPADGAVADDAVTTPTNLNQSLSILLTSGVPLVVSQAADPITDRQVRVEVKATVLK